MAKTVSAAPTSPMHDIPLSAAEEGGDSVNETNKSGGKAKTLKRFFKIANRRHSTGGELPTSSNETTPDDGAESKDEADNEAEKDDELEKPAKRDHGKRFHLRLGGVSRVVDQTSTGSFMANAPSRQSLKNSITGYWHTVFKRTSKKSSKQKSDENGDGDEAEVEEETNATELQDEVQTLSISEDTVEQVMQAIE
ncbi:uncharacterized protein [Eurosta solidaginis]|uniref:uncharacterized protein n=1 Tax=Eurosta solidaginis TaxID=178769 RepID=UPI003530BB0E